jgi:cytochrome c oxidase subunit 3
VPLLNTLVLLSSGVRVTWAHHALIRGNHTNAANGTLITIILGAYFTCLQALEYYEARFRIADRIYGSSFFVATGFHGLHVLVGSSFLLVCYLRIKANHFRATHHFGFEAAAWY